MQPQEYDEFEIEYTKVSGILNILVASPLSASRVHFIFIFTAALFVSAAGLVSYLLFNLLIPSLPLIRVVFIFFSLSIPVIICIRSQTLLLLLFTPYLNILCLNLW